MKKISIILGLVLVLSIGTVVAYADAGVLGSRFYGRHSTNLSQESIDELLKEGANFREERLDEALKDGTISEAKAKEWEEHFKYMDEFHEENGYLHAEYGCGGGYRNNGMGHHRSKGNHGMMMRGHSY